MSSVEITRPRDGVALVTLNRPESLNAMNAALIADLHAALATLRPDRSCRVIVLTGAGRAFCTRLDLKEGATPPEAGIDLENRTQLLASHTGDMMEAVAAFLAKRPPKFTDS